MYLNVKVTPKSSKNRISGWVGKTLKICVTAAPEKGKANDAMITVLSKALEISKSQIRLVRGETSSQKVVDIDGGEDLDLLQRLEEHLKRDPP
ncbi:MAG TPA: DUF167 domain-containing protein [Nitrospiria bacterium]|jgi:hypothetical protein